MSLGRRATRGPTSSVHEGGGRKAQKLTQHATRAGVLCRRGGSVRLEGQRRHPLALGGCFTQGRGGIP